MTNDSQKASGHFSNRNFSIVTPVFNPQHQAFEQCVDSVLKQTYPHWEWCIADDCSTDPWIQKKLRKLAGEYRNIKVVHRDSNGGISRASNDAIALASGDYIAFLDHDDELHFDALAAVNHELSVYPETDFVYSDVDRINEVGEHVDYFPKPDWSPERLLGQNYCCHLSVIRSQLVSDLGGLRIGYEGAQDHDLLLRLSELPIKVRHIPRILYHWRVSANSTASNISANPHAIDAMESAIKDACSRRNFDAELVHLPQGYFRVRRRLSREPLTSIIIPTRGTIGSIWGLEVPYVENLLLSFLQKTTYSNVEFIIVFDTATDSALLQRLCKLPLTLQLVEFSERFNFSKKCNLGVVRSTGDRLIFLNDDVEIITSEWIERMIVFLEDDSVGAVGPLLLYDNGLIQSAGHANPGPCHFARGVSPATPYGAAWPLVLNREVSGVTGACLAMRRETFFEVGGFSEIFPGSFNDVDLGMKLTSSGYRIIWTPDAELFHFESKSRDPEPEPFELELLHRYWGREVGEGKIDPFTR